MLAYLGQHSLIGRDYSIRSLSGCKSNTLPSLATTRPAWPRPSRHFAASHGGQLPPTFVKTKVNDMTQNNERPYFIQLSRSHCPRCSKEGIQPDQQSFLGSDSSQICMRHGSAISPPSRRPLDTSLPDESDRSSGACFRLTVLKPDGLSRIYRLT
jgi:hypothetical protein